MKTSCYWSVVWFEVDEISNLGDLREILEIFDEKWGNEVLSVLKTAHIAAWVKLHRFNTCVS